MGEMDPRLGRRLSARQRAGPRAFLHSLKDIIKSNLSNRLKRVRWGDWAASGEARRGAAKLWAKERSEQARHAVLARWRRRKQ